MRLTSEMIREAAEGIDSAVQIKFRSYSGRGMYGKECPAVVVSNPGDLVKFGMSLAYVVAQSGDEFMVEGGEVDLIDDAISEFNTPATDGMAGEIVAYWPFVPFETEGN
jgi:hypothetical protein